MVVGGKDRFPGRRVAACTVAVVVFASLLAVVAPAGAVRAAAPGTAEERYPSGDVPALPAASTYVRDLYLSVLNREPSRDDVAYWGGLLDSGVAAPVVAGELTRSTEWTRKRVRAIYELLGRKPDPGGLAHWTEAIRSGAAPVEEATALIVGSAEYYERAGGTNRKFVEALYRDILSRTADPGGLAYWTAQLEAGLNRPGLVHGFVRNEERQARLLRRVVRRVLDRPVTAADAPWAAGFATGSNTEPRIIATVAGSDEAVGAGCDATVERACLLPFPNDLFTAPDPTTATGRRVAFKPQWMPRNAAGVSVDPVEWNRNDGFSPGQAALAHVPGVSLTRSNGVPVTDLGRYDDADTGIMVFDTVSGERWPIWTELDAATPAAERPADQLLYIRPAKNWIEGRRYIVVLRDLRDAAGNVLPASDTFARYRDASGAPAGVGGFERRRPRYEAMFDEIENLGVQRSSLYLAWDFTVASMHNIAGRMLTLRDDGFTHTTDGTPSFRVTGVEPNPQEGILRRVTGTFEVPLYLTGDGAPGSRQTTDATGKPEWSGRFRTATFTCRIPVAATGQPSRPVVYGHGLLGDQGEVNSGSLTGSITRHDMTYCATDWLGMSEEDLINTIGILSDFSKFPQLADRTQQGILSFLFLARLLKAPTGFVADPAFRADGEPLIDPTAVFYDGNSQGGIMGGALMAVSTDIERGVLGVTGMNYSTLLERSVDFDPFYGVFQPNYPDRVERTITIGLAQMLWDRGEANGYAAHLTDAPLPGTPPHRVLLQVALGDHQVAPVTAEVQARTIGAAAHRPAYAPGRTADVEGLWGIPSITYPWAESALVVFDSGAPVPPVENLPPRTGEDPHGDPRADVQANVQKSEFLKVDGRVVDVCNAAPCTAAPR
jgi:hypothetical protein